MENVVIILFSDKKTLYLNFIKKCQHHQGSLDELIDLGTKLMKRAKLHHHFFHDHSLHATAKALAYYALDINTHTKSDKINESQALSVIALFDKRIEERLPVEYIVHEAQYLNRLFYVNENVLIPRSIMNTRFQDFIKDIPWTTYRVLDLCTGSGCIGITLALMEPKLTVDLADISEKALEVANINVKRYELNHRVHCIQSDLFENIHQTYDLIITNPPYVSTKDYEKSPAEFKKEPKIALEAGIDGLKIIDRIIHEAPDFLNANGLLIAEVGSPAVSAIKKKYPSTPFQWLKYRSPKGKISFFAEPGILIYKK